MKVAALFSGGKDSTLAVWVVENWGWEVTHLVSVLPFEKDSWMFHVPNVHLTPLLSEAMGKEHVLVKSKGSEGELHDLEEALRDLPVEGIVSGAVASEYQRVRIERLGGKLGLKTWTPLWHKNPWALLETLVEGGWEVRFSAVSAEGLGPSWIGSPLDSTCVDLLRKLHERYRVHPQGEGGEYETIVLDGPNFERRVEVVRAHTSWENSRGVWVVEEVRLLPKPPRSFDEPGGPPRESAPHRGS